jgi:antitoxin component YwqK of YwqJK toxin-antitoxin module
MKKYLLFLTVCLFILFQPGCTNKASKKQSAAADVDTQTVADTGFTGIKQFYSKKTLTYEATFKNGVREGLMKSYYPSGKLRQTFWYRNGMKEDTAVWFYEEGNIFRKTPFRRDSMNGIQIQYYKSGAIRAKMSFVNGLRTPWLEEYTSDGRKITDYPTVTIRTKDNYQTNGTYDIYLGLDRKNIKVNFYAGEFVDSLFTPKKLVKINATDFTGFIQLRKSNSQGRGWIGIISEISTSLGNKQLVYNKVTLPYNDLR